MQGTMYRNMEVAPPNRILFIRPSALGDVCRSVPVVASLHAAYPESAIDWLVQTEFADAISSHPSVSEAIAFPRKTLSRWYTPDGFASLKNLISDLRAKKYDLVIDGQGLGRSGLLSFVTGSSRRIGLKNAREFGWIGYTQRVNASSAHTVDQMLELVSNIGIEPVRDMQLYAPRLASEWWAAQQNNMKLTADYIVLAPTSRWLSKRWPINYFVEIAKYLQSIGKTVVVVGAPLETNQVKPLLQLKGVINLMPKLSVANLLAVIKQSSLVIANDSAALHIAVGFNVPCLGLFGPTNPICVGPYNCENSVISTPVEYSSLNYRDPKIGDSIMKKISVAEVRSRLDNLLQEL